MIGDQVVESVANEKDEEESADHADYGQGLLFCYVEKDHLNRTNNAA